MDSLHRPLTVNAQEVVAASLRGDDATAIRMIRWIIKGRPETAPFFYLHPEPSVRFNYLRAGNVSARGAEIFKPCPIFGAPDGKLSQRQRSIGESILNAHWEAWEKGEMPAPARRGVFAGYSKASIANIKLAIVFQKFHLGDPELTENVYFHNLLGSATLAGINTVAFAADGILYDGHLIKRPKTPETIAESLAAFDRFLDETRPDIVVADGNFPPTENTITPAFWAAVKQKYGFKLVVMIPDCYDMPVHFTSYWKKEADLIVAFHTPSMQLIDVENAVVLPSLPVDESLIYPDARKTFGVKYVGSETRNRLDWLGALATFNNQVFVKTAGIGGLRMKTMRDYGAEISGIRITFNNGRIDANADAITLRVAETILAKTVLMQEDNSAIRQYLVPFVHYIPVANATQFICFTQFFLESDEWCKRITSTARSFWLEHYSSELTWRFICNKALCEPEAPSSN